MRTQSISTLPAEQEWLAGPVDATGWLTGPCAGSPLETGTEPGTLERGRGTERGAGGNRPVRRPGRIGRSAELGAARVARTRRHRRASIRAVAEPVLVVAPEVTPDVDRLPVVDGYRMGRWARLALTLTVLTATAVVIGLLVAGSAPQTLVDVTVGPGDSLWSIAAAASPDSDPRATIEQIRQINGITGDALPVGVVLRVPAAGD